MVIVGSETSALVSVGNSTTRSVLPLQSSNHAVKDPLYNTKKGCTMAAGNRRDSTVRVGYCELRGKSSAPSHLLAWEIAQFIQFFRDQGQ